MTETWWLKLDRAQEHLDELQDEIGRYARLEPYHAEEGRQPKGKRHLATYVLRFSKPPMPRISLLAGDCAHNMRSALDHLAVAMSDKDERSSAKFPIEEKPIWQRGADGEFVVKDDDARDRFARAIRGMTPEAKALVKRMQPYNFERNIANALRVVRAIDNADKHRDIIGLKPVLDGSTISLWRNGKPLLHESRFSLAYDGAQLGEFDFSAISPRLWATVKTNVQVKVRGSLHVAMEIVDVTGPMDVLELSPTLAYLREAIVPSLEQCVR